jgi:hypothetical protein
MTTNPRTSIGIYQAKYIKMHIPNYILLQGTSSLRAVFQGLRLHPPPQSTLSNISKGQTSGQPASAPHLTSIFGNPINLLPAIAGYADQGTPPD